MYSHVVMSFDVIWTDTGMIYHHAHGTVFTTAKVFPISDKTVLVWAWVECNVWSKAMLNCRRKQFHGASLSLLSFAGKFLTFWHGRGQRKIKLPTIATAAEGTSYSLINNMNKHSEGELTMNFIFLAVLTLSSCNPWPTIHCTRWPSRRTVPFLRKIWLDFSSAYTTFPSKAIVFIAGCNLQKVNQNLGRLL